MAGWMRYRRHGWVPVWEMTTSMFVVPSFAAIALLWAGAVADTDALLYIPYIGMFPSMLVVMRFRLDEYTPATGTRMRRGLIAASRRAGKVRKLRRRP